MLIKKFFKKTYFIAEIGVNHNGSLSIAKKMVISAKRSGADAVKFQTFKAENLVTPNTPKVYYQKKTTSSKLSHFDMIKSLELSKGSHIELRSFCKKRSIDFISTPYDTESAIFLKNLGCNIFKTSSADIVDLELHTYLAKTKKTVIISTGMSTIEEIKKCIKIYKKYSNKNYILLHCVSNYPCSLKSLNLNAIPLMQKKFKCHVGFSDHSVGHDAAKISVSLGARIIEKHFTTNRKLSGPDQKTSVLPHEFKNMVSEVRKTELILGKAIKSCQKEELEMSKISRKSLTIITDILKGQSLQKKHLTLKRPGTGIYFSEIQKVLGKKAKKNMKVNHQIKFKEFK
tara:strand:- start:2100 stop:3128 length:1029 start_codon:yes stop_codon:yes gene_type:complete